MGDNKIIWIPAALHQMLKDFEKDDVMVSIKKVASKRVNYLLSAVVIFYVPHFIWWEYWFICCKDKLNNLPSGITFL
jgi:hypothetical protein